LLDWSRDNGWSSTRARGIAVLALPLLAYATAETLEGNAFVAAFVGGVVFGRFAHCVEVEASVTETLEIAADLLGWILWLLAGALFVSALEYGFSWQWLVLAVLVLTVLRLVPVAVALAGTGFRWPTVLFLGWFGPRGIATIVFGLLALESLGDDALLSDVAGVLSVTVLISVVAHGLTAGPLSQRYAAWVVRTHGPIETEPSIEPRPARGRGSMRG
jgi:NhaP-type Na+/H+ or K+/H+ antiporter